MRSANFCVDLWQASHQTFSHHPIRRVRCLRRRLPAAGLTLKKLGLGVRVREGFGVGDGSREDRRKKLTISWDNSVLPSYCHI